jgi:hypothetical protein
MAKMVNRGTIPTCGADTSGGCTGGTCSDIRFKHSIVHLGVSPRGIPFYSFRYQPDHRHVGMDLDTEATYVGAMAQDLIVLAPEAVCRHASDGYYRVDYSQIDVDFLVVTTAAAAAIG